MHVTTRDKIIQEAIKWKGTPYLWGGNSTAGIDCSHFVWQVYKTVVYDGLPYIFSSPSADAAWFNRVAESAVLKGDLIVWGAQHIGIVVDPDAGSFIGAQCSTGVAGAYYKSGYWNQNNIYFLQFIW